MVRNKNMKKHVAYEEREIMRRRILVRKRNIR